MRALLARVHTGPAAVLAVLTLSACLLIAGMPRVLQAAYDEGLRRTLSTTSAQEHDLVVTSMYGDVLQERGQFEARERAFRKLLPPGLASVVTTGGTSHIAAATVETPAKDRARQYINVGWLSDLARRVDWVSGRPPGRTHTAYVPDQRKLGTVPVVEVGVSEDAAQRMNLGIGTFVVLGVSHHTAIQVTGIYRPKDAADGYWEHNLDAYKVERRLVPGAEEPDLYITTLTSDQGLRALSDGNRRVVYSWVFGVDTERVSAREVPDTVQAIKDFQRAVAVEVGSFNQGRLETGLPRRLAGFLGSLATAQTVMYLVLGGLVVVALGVIVLAVRLLAERMDAALALMRARGGSLPQVTSAGLAQVALATLPAALAGYLLAYLVPGPLTPIVHVGPLLVPLCALGYAAVRLTLAHRTPLNERRDDVTSAKPSARRITLEVMIVALALAGAYLLRSRGVTTEVGTQGQDPFLLLVPVALAVAAGLVTLRCYPYPLRAIVRLAAARRPAVPFIGLTLAARARSFTVLPVLILLPALAVSVFASVVSSGVSSTQELAAWQQVGAQIRAEHEVEIPPEAVRRIERVPGVERVVTAETGLAQIARSHIAVISIDLAAYQDVLNAGPVRLPPPPTGPGTPVLVSPKLPRDVTFTANWHVPMKLTSAGVIDSLPGMGPQGEFVVMPADANERSGTPTRVNLALIKGDADPAAVAAAANLPGLRVRSQAQALAEIRQAPLTSTVQSTLVMVTAALAGYAMIAVIMTLVITAPARARTLSFLSTLGLSPGQAQRLTVLEVSPMILITALAGLGLGLVLPAALGPGLDLSAYTGSVAVGGYRTDLLTPVLLGVGLTAVSVLGAYAHTALSRRRSLGFVLRVGD